MTSDTLTAFDHDYLSTWTEPDTAVRRAAIERIWAPEGRMVISSLGVTVDGIDAIADHVDQVHEDNIVGHGLRFSYDQHVEAGDATLLRWSMTAPDDAVVGRGADVIFRDDQGRVTTAYMFLGVA